MKTYYDFKNNVLNIKIEGGLVGNSVELFENEALPIVLGLNANNISINKLIYQLLN